jgi:uncharacterized membrane protein
VHRFELIPNCSLTTAKAVVFYLGIATVSLTVAVGFALAGYWPVLPFAGLELLALGLALRWSLHQGQRRELIRIDEGRVLVRKTSRNDARDYEFARPWTRVELVKARAGNWPRRLLLRSKGTAVEIGGFLTDSERASLGERLAEMIPGVPGSENVATDNVIVNRSPETEWKV